MKLIAPVIGLLVTLATSPTTFAGSSYGYDGHRGGHHRGHHRQYRPHRRAHRSRSHRGEYLVGGILIGSLIANSIHHSRHHRPYVERRLSQPSRTIRTEHRTETIERRLLRDGSGNCFELFTARDGTEIREPIARAECSW